MPTNSPLDKILDGGIESDAITNIYGPAGSGKTNIALAAAIACGSKVVYMDTEGSFSAARFRQLGGTDKDMKRIILIDVHEWAEQHSNILKLEKLAEKEKPGIVIIDSLVALYRLELGKENFQSVNKQLAEQYMVLSKIARKHKIPVLVTNQVYSLRTGAGEQIEMTSRTIAKYWSKALIELKKLDGDNQRVAIIRKHRSIAEGKKVEFEITKNGFKTLGKLSLF
jgi:DNA repair protein RadB